MRLKSTIFFFCLCVATGYCQFFSLKNLGNYAKIFRFNGLLANETGNELWTGLFRDCDRSVTFSCIQKNAYTYLDNVFVERDNITVLDGLTMTKNDLDYGTCHGRNEHESVDENLVEGSDKDDCDEEESDEEEGTEGGRGFEEEQTPLEEVTNALRKRAIKFLATRDYQIQLPEFFFNGADIKISPREVDENGALVRVDFGQRGLTGEGRIFKKIKKFIQNKLLTSLLALLLIVKLIKLKFMFVIPFLFGVGTAKKLFLKLLLFFIPAFAHIFKLCSSYYTSQSTKYHHHHHQIAHHHHHVPVPVPVPTYYNHQSHHHHEEEDFDGYDYAHPHIQYRKDIEELKEWGIEPYEEPYEIHNEPVGAGTVPVRTPGVLPAPFPGPTYGNSYGVHQYAPNAQPVPASYPEKRPQPMSAHNLAYSAYADNNRRAVVQQLANSANFNSPNFNSANSNPGNLNPANLNPGNLSPGNLNPANLNSGNLSPGNLNPANLNPANLNPGNLNPANLNPGNLNPGNLSPGNLNPANLPSNLLPAATNVKNYGVFGQQNVRQVIAKSKPVEVKVNVPVQRQGFGDDYYGPIIGRLEEIFRQLKFLDENCRERLVCSMYKNPAVYSPHSNLVSNELSRDPQELKHAGTESPFSQKFHRYLSAARLGQDGGDCLRMYPCHINTE